jgi:twitching motility protein PilJ
MKINSIGTKLFIAVMGGAIIGLGGVAWVFKNKLEQQAKEQIQDKLNAQVALIEAQLNPIAQEGLALKSTLETLHEQGITSENIYQNLAFIHFKQRPELSFGLGFGQTPNGLLKERRWFFHYYYEDQKVKGQSGTRLPPPNQNVFYSELYKDNDYPNQPYYKEPVRIKLPFWTEPYGSYGALITTFTTPIFNQDRQVIGVVKIDINVLKLTQELNTEKVYDNQGYFALLSSDGRILVYPPKQPAPPPEGEYGSSYTTVKELVEVMDRIKERERVTSGIFKMDNTNSYWAYQKMKGTNWIMLASVPADVITRPVLFITVMGTLFAGLVLGVVVFSFVFRLNRRLKPILDECHKLAQTDATTEDKLQKEDEIGQLSLSFFNLLDTLAAKEEAIRQEIARSVQNQEDLKQAAESQKESDALQEEVSQILDVVLAIEDGDLTVQAEVSSRPTGLVADTLNRLIESLGGTISFVLDTSQKVNQSAEKLEDLAVSAQGQVQQQTQSVSDVQSLVVNFNELSQETANQALLSDQSVQQAVISVNQGEQEITKMTQEIKLLQQETKQIVKRSELLISFVTSAAQFTKEQKRLAALTRVLALNASMIAARASEQQDPEQFASIASEFETISSQVNELAVETNQGLLRLQQQTDQIQTVVSGLTQDVADISGSVNQFILSVDESSQVFDRIKNVTAQVSQVAQQVTQSSRAIAETAQLTLRSIQDIAAVAEETERQSGVTREQAGLMEQLARTLLERVQFFRLPSKQ